MNIIGKAVQLNELHGFFYFLTILNLFGYLRKMPYFCHIFGTGLKRL